MKRFFTFILALCCYCSHASDTLTVAEVYNFNVGDTFDYKRVYSNTSGFFNHTSESYFRLVVSEMSYSAGMDTLIVTYTDQYGIISYDTISNLSQKAIYSIDSIFPGTDICQYSYSIQNSPFSSRPINELWESCFEYGSRYSFGYGLGRLYYEYGHGNGGDGFEVLEMDLIYFSNGDTSIGIPYTLLTSIDEQFPENTLALYPNPANGQVTFNSNGATKYSSYSVYNIDGSVVASGNIDAGAVTISTVNFAKGMYYLNAYSTGGNSVSRRFIVAE